MLAAGFVAIVACGPSAEEKATDEKAVQDSIAAAEQAAMATQSAMADSAAAVMPTDTTAVPAEEVKK